MESFVNGFRVWKMVFALDWWRRRRRSRAQILRRQGENRDRLLDFAARRCSFYAERLKGRDLSHLTLEDFPPVDKTLVMENFEGLLTDPTITREEAVEFVSDPSRVGGLFKGRYVASHTSGSSGLRGVFLIDKWGWEMSQALGLSGNGLPPLSFAGWLRVLQAPFRPIPAALVIPMQGHYSSVLVTKIRSPFVDRFVRLHFFEITEPFERIVEELNALSPFSVHSYPTMLDVLAREKERGNLRVDLKIITAAGEPFPQEIKDHVRRAWPGVLIFDIYASTEVLNISKTCRFGHHHLNEDWIIVENVDADGRPVPVGERGDKIYITSLFNYLMPLIRYEVTDSVIFDETPCPCGLPMVKLNILGRTNHTLRLPGEAGRPVNLLPTPLLVAFMDVPGLRQYQVIQQAPEHLHVRFVPEDDAEEDRVRGEIERVFGAYLKKHGVIPHLRLSYERVPDIPRDPRTHKIMQIIALN